MANNWFYFDSFSYSLSLLWYYTIITPFFALDGSNLDSEIEEANSLLEEAQDGFADAALFLFFKGRVERLKVSVLLFVLL